MQIIQNQTFNNGLRIENTSDVIVQNCSLNGLGLLVLNSSNITILNNTFWNTVSYGIYLVGACSNVLIDGNLLSPFVSNTVPGHHIQTSAGDHSSIFISNNTVIGRSVAAYKDVNGNWIENGASGDMIVIRLCDGFVCRDNYLKGGGEFGITCWSRNGQISRNTILDCDATPILLGTSLHPSENVDIVENWIVNGGRNWQGHSTNQSGIWARRTLSCAIMSNTIRNTIPTDMIYGLQARDSRKLKVKGNRIFSDYLTTMFRIPQVVSGTVVDLDSDIAPTQ